MLLLSERVRRIRKHFATILKLNQAPADIKFETSKWLEQVHVLDEISTAVRDHRRILLQKDQQQQLKYLYSSGDLFKVKENLKETGNINRNY